MEGVIPMNSRVKLLTWISVVVLSWAVVFLIVALILKAFGR